MNSSNANLLSFVLCITVLLSSACSSYTATPTLPTTSMIAPTPTLLPFTGKIAFLQGSGNWFRLYVMNANGTGLTEITPPNLSSISSPSWSPDAQYIAFDAKADQKNAIRQVYIIKADGSDLKQLTFGQQSSYGPSWSPGGENIIFTHDDTNLQNKFGWNPQELDIMNSDGTEVRQLVSDVSAYSYRKDGSISVSIPATRDLMKTFIINSEGTVQDQLPNFPNHIVPQWSPDGKTIVAVDVYHTDCTDIVVMKSDGYKKSCLKIDGIIPPALASAATWSPDGKYIIFSANPGGKWKIYVVKPDGTDLIQLVNLDDVGPAVWSAEP